MSRRSVNLTGARWVAVAGVAALTIVVVVLAALALQRSRGEGDAAANPVPSFTLGVTTPSPTPTPTPEASPGAHINRAEERFLTAGSQVWWRATAGECGVTEPLVERSDDGGATWTDVTPRYLGIGQVMGMSAFSAVDVEMVAVVGPECEVQALRTYTDGEFWEPYPETISASSYVDPLDRGVLIINSEPTAAPCSHASGLRNEGAVVAFVCDGDAYLTSGGLSNMLSVSGVVALHLFDSVLYVAQTDSACEGVNIVAMSVEAPSAVRSIACVPAQEPVSSAALATDNGDLFFWSGAGLTFVGSA